MTEYCTVCKATATRHLTDRIAYCEAHWGEMQAARCHAKVLDDTGWHNRKCERRAVEGSYCKQHAEMKRAGRLI